MRTVRRAGTACETIFETGLIEAKLTYSKQLTILDCNPDFVFLRQRIAVFIDGDFWHGRIALEESRRALYRAFRPDHREFWIAKILRNIERDRRQNARLRRRGWSVMRFWEKDLLRGSSKAIDMLLRKLNARSTKARPAKPLSSVPLSHGQLPARAGQERRYRSGARASSR